MQLTKLQSAQAAPSADSSSQPNSQTFRQSTEWLMTTLQSIGDAVITTDNDGCITFMNPVAEKLTGWSEEEACDQPLETVFRIVDARTGQEIENPVQRVLKNGEAITLAHRTLLLARGDVAINTAISIEVSATPIREPGVQSNGASPDIVGVVLIFRDVREQDTTQESLRHSEERYHCLVNATAQIVWTTPPDGAVTDMPMWRAYTGQSLEEVRGWGWLDAVHADDRLQALEAWQLAVSTRGIYETEYRVRRHDGEYEPFWVRGVPVLERNGEIREWVGACTNISSRKRVEEDLQASLARQAQTATELSCVLAQIADGVVIVDATGRITFVNDVVRQLQGVDICGMTMGEYSRICDVLTLAGEPYEAGETPLERALNGGRPVIGEEMQLSRPDGTHVMVQGNAVPLFSSDARPLGAVLTLRDVTPQRQVMQELVRVNRMKDEFLAILSHELRTPLTPILGWASLLRQTKGENPEVLLQAAEAIERNAETQKRLIEDLLDTTRMFSGKLSIERSESDLNGIIALATESAQRAVAGRDISIQTQLDPDIPNLQLDPVRMQQVLWNLISNAIKFSGEQNIIRVRSRFIKGDMARDESPHVEVEIADEGEGIAAEVLPHIFEHFRQGDSSYTRRHGGLGLGLSIARSLIEVHGGTIEARSAGTGAGSTFTIHLPV